jgi:hypothetical protein
VRSKATGIVMGHAVNPLVHQGDGLVHIAELDQPTDMVPAPSGNGAGA